MAETRRGEFCTTCCVANRPLNTPLSVPSINKSIEALRGTAYVLLSTDDVPFLPGRVRELLVLRELEIR